MKSLKKEIKEEAASISSRIKKNSVSVALIQTSEPIVNIPDEIPTQHVIKLLQQLKNKK
ncbi:uncharacterized protein NEMAJ01_1006 [Nematocida major]|uniref:uncharacterized protein n=1 Tax=Nematocida major TaxID=1912982 RepID=UPI002008DAF8|nr:uncharacterized protein NEMAJ01_1006 [Nematocida major]KAH9386110.1 hypothetical protein NEMAJ01_1006 [Nematocida major]